MVLEIAWYAVVGVLAVGFSMAWAAILWTALELIRMPFRHWHDH